MAGGGAALALAPAAARAAAAVAPVANPFAPPPGTAFLIRNENPYGPSPAALRAIADQATNGCYYSDSAEEALAAMIAERHGLTPAHVLIGAGSSEVLNTATMGLSAGGHILASELTFNPPLSYAQEKGVAVRTVPLDATMGIDLRAMAAAVTADTRLVHVCNPNNPTGRLLPAADLRRLAAGLGPNVVLLVDEAYNELTDDPAANSLVDRVRAGDAVVVARTFSKIYGLAGMRVGYALARPDIIARMKPWSMSVGNSVSGLAAALASYNDTAFLNMSKARILEARQIIEEAARANGLTYLPSATNFVYVKVPDAEKLRAAMERQGVLIRGPYGSWTQWSRVSCGRIADVKRYAAALPAALSA